MSVTEEAIEAGAKAAYEAVFREPNRVPWEKTHNDTKIRFRREAQAIIDAARARSTKRTVCSVCGQPTNLACSDCRIDFQTTIYVCPSCIDRHEEKCSASVRARAKKAEAERDAANERIGEWVNRCEFREAERDDARASADALVGVLRLARPCVEDAWHRRISARENHTPKYGRRLVDEARDALDKIDLALAEHDARAKAGEPAGASAGENDGGAR